MSGIIIFLLAVVSFFIYRGFQRNLRTRRAQFIDNFEFHPAVINKFRDVRPDFTPQQEELVFAALRDYFHLCNRAGKRMVSMPSQVVDDAWHAFILFTRGYQRFCRNAFGRFLHHTPAEAMSSPTLAGEGIKRAWRLACDHDNIDPKHPSRLPLLFAIDADLKIENGFFYTTDCSRERSGASDHVGVGSYCGSHIGCASGCGGDSGAEDSGGGCGGDSGDSGGGGCGGGCGGD